MKKENRSQLIKLLVEIFREIFSWDFDGDVFRILLKIFVDVVGFLTKLSKPFFLVIENSPSATCRLGAQCNRSCFSSYPWLAPLDGKGIPM